MQFTVTQRFKELLIGGVIVLVPAVGTLNGAKLNLGKTDLDVTVNTPLATLTGQVADFTGYAAKTITWSPPTLGSGGLIQTVGEHPEFRPTDAVIPNTVHNAWITDSTGAELLAVAKFDVPGKPMGSALNSIDIAIILRPDAAVPVNVLG